MVPQAGQAAAEGSPGGDVGTLARLGESLGALPEPLRLADVQRALAREHGYGSWPGFRRAVLEAQGAAVRSVSRIEIEGVEAYEATARGLAAAVGRGDPLALRRVRAHVARLARLSDATLAGRPLARGDARLVVAREYGFPDLAGAGRRGRRDARARRALARLAGTGRPADGRGHRVDPRG